jgi:uncharacterized membrane protein YhaH (DUF805 family)
MSIWQAMSGTDGRISRATFGKAFCVLVIAYVVVFAAAYALRGGRWQSGPGSETFLSAREAALAYLISSLVLLYFSFAISIRRLHDMDRSGWWCAPVFAVDLFYALALVLGWVRFPPLGGALGQTLDIGHSVLLGVLIIALAAIRGTHGPNAYGAEPVRA